MNFSARTAALRICALMLLSFASFTAPSFGQGAGHAHGKQAAKPTGPWMNTSLSPDDRAALVLKELTLDEKILLIHGAGLEGMTPISPTRINSNGGVGFVMGIPRLGIPGIDMSDAAYGVRSSGENGRYSTALPANVGAAASWDVDAAYEYGAVIGRELRAQGFNMSLGGGTNLTRESRNGRTFEYLGEDPVLAGTLVGKLIQGTQSQHVIGDIKHYAFNDQESGRNSVNIHIDERAGRESDLLAFEIGVATGHPAATMCSYNRINGDFACENKYLLTTLLKKDWKFPGFVLSDWGGTHSTEKASAAGLDNEEPGEFFYGDAYKTAVQSGKISTAELDDHVQRILRSMFAAGVVDFPRERSVIDVLGDLDVARRIEEGSIVLLKNTKSVLPLDPAKVRSIAVIGAHADVGMISGGGSAQVDPPGGNAIMPPGQGATHWQEQIWFPTSPLKAIQARAPEASVKYDPGTDPAAAAEAAKGADVAVVFAYVWESEGMDLPNLSLTGNQDAVVAAVAAANPKTIVVLETGSPVTMPWVDSPAAILEAWYAGSDGANALGNVLFGSVNPSGKLPNTFPKSEADLPHPTIVKPPPASENFTGPVAPAVRAAGLPAFQATYDEGLKVGYKWYDAENKPVLFPFGYGLSYTTYDYTGLTVTPGQSVEVTFTVANTGGRNGSEVAEVYAALPASADEPPKRLVGFTKVKLQTGEKRTVTVEVDPKYLSIFDVKKNDWSLVPGDYTFMVGGSSADLPLKQVVTLR
ncbi:Beta-glucosidase [Acidisarcina polymorpha]|uniref:Beta-glucosidase n=1 Tax=Acidisarcina polymorpha TaxID=2211140 RepID=A0A2Z5FXK1_9BACT|nr:glycoside hydrolase family 3 C-terminal domain-containing protein [Acidisarcina polymorpha]AXC11460.1 Beta-glucosidase [Acidisarcina polymorpha]